MDSKTSQHFNLMILFFFQIFKVKIGVQQLDVHRTFIGNFFFKLSTNFSK